MPTDAGRPKRATASISVDSLILGILSRNPEASDIEHLAVATALAADLNHTARQLVTHFVENARREGRTWAAMAAAVRSSKQSLHKRFAPQVTDSLLTKRTADPGDTT
ncbi:hypothetical protein AB0P17_07825 [Streptomyces sp. NPDC088124]|uniref:hypothetical protein n=1 Tax=Streptomyces sp. NPDC088124 TaxID=3154654 RepID=UPI003439B7F4